MSANAFHNIAKIEDRLWEAADQLRANSKLTSSEYCMPVLGVIFLRHASNRYNAARQAIEDDQVAGRMPKRPLVKGDFIKRRALLLPEQARKACEHWQIPGPILPKQAFQLVMLRSKTLPSITPKPAISSRY